MAREKILVVDRELNTLSKIYLALLHRKFKAEACNDSKEIFERLKRYKPSIIILGLKDYEEIYHKLKIPAIIMLEKESLRVEANYGDIQIKKPVTVEVLINAVEKLI